MLANHYVELCKTKKQNELPGISGVNEENGAAEESAIAGSSESCCVAITDSIDGTT